MNERTKRARLTVFISLIVLATVGLPVRARYAGGTGTADDPYLIETAEQINTIGLYPEDCDKHFRLTADIDMNDLAGAKINLITTFEGVFDGNEHTIANLTYRVADADAWPEMPYVWGIGLFRAVLGVDALVKDLGLVHPDLQPGPDGTKEVRSMGALVGILSQGWVRNCYVEGGRVAGSSSVGGLVGECRDNGAVSDSWSSAEVSGDRGIGGLVGNGHQRAQMWQCHARAQVSGRYNIGGLVGDWSQECTIDDCFATGTVTAVQQAGGLAGFLGGSVFRCYSTAPVSADSLLVGGLVGINSGLITASWAGGDIAGGNTVGGLVGWNMVGDGFFIPYFDTTVADCYATGTVRGQNIVGGLIGSNDGTVLRCYAVGKVTALGEESVVGGLVAADEAPAWDVRNCFWDTTTSGVLLSEGGTGIATAEMQNLATYIAAGWDFTDEIANGTEDLWKMTGDQAAYPKLAWEEGP
jgi:hypothetical protein